MSDGPKVIMKNQNKKITELEKRIDLQNEIIHQQNARLTKQDEKFAR